MEKKWAVIGLVILLVFFLLWSIIGGATSRSEIKTDLRFAEENLEIAQAFIHENCANFSIDALDLTQVRDLAEDQIISHHKNARNIQYKEIHAIGEACSASWWLVADYDDTLNDTLDVKATAFMQLDAHTGDLQHFNSFSCVSRFYIEEFFSEAVECQYAWDIRGVIGETQHELQGSVDRLDNY